MYIQNVILEMLSKPYANVIIHYSALTASCLTRAAHSV